MTWARARVICLDCVRSSTRTTHAHGVCRVVPYAQTSRRAHDLESAVAHGGGERLPSYLPTFQGRHVVLTLRIPKFKATAEYDPVLSQSGAASSSASPTAAKQALAAAEDAVDAAQQARGLCVRARDGTAGLGGAGVRVTRSARRLVLGHALGADQYEDAFVVCIARSTRAARARPPAPACLASSSSPRSRPPRPSPTSPQRHVQKSGESELKWGGFLKISSNLVCASTHSTAGPPTRVCIVRADVATATEVTPAHG